MTSILYIPEEVSETLLYLEYVGGVTEGKKLFFKQMVYVGDTDYYLRYKRYSEGENIESQLDTLKDIFKRYVRAKNSFDKIFVKKLDEAYERFVKGICVLSLTYKDNSKLNKFCNLVNDHQKMKFSLNQESDDHI